MAPPKFFLRFLESYPEVGKAYQALGEATRKAGPLSEREVALVKLGMSIGLRHEGAVHAHTRRALETGLTPEELRHAVLLGVTTIGFPSTMAALSWVEDVLQRNEQHGD
ncbi:carboxymuconolactone decarboxylase family protein [Rhodothermus marinus]|uniref:carboxymuconolactone decarboxylase family protein n=1 Tax=Rhodothermus marinus TaxID=29549 RepID=UPI0037C558B9